MKKHYCSRVLTCTPRGEITNLDAVTMKRLVSQCCKDVEEMTSVTEKAKRMMSMAAICKHNRYLRTALNLYRRAAEIIATDAILNYSMRNRILLSDICISIDSLWREFSRDPQRESEARKARMLYMCIHHDYRDEILEIEDYDSDDNLDYDLVKDYYETALNRDR